MRVSIKEFDIHLIHTFRTTHGAIDTKRALIVDIDGIAPYYALLLHIHDPSSYGCLTYGQSLSDLDIACPCVLSESLKDSHVDIVEWKELHI